MGPLEIVNLSVMERRGEEQKKIGRRKRETSVASDGFERERKGAGGTTRSHRTDLSTEHVGQARLACG